MPLAIKAHGPSAAPIDRGAGFLLGCEGMEVRSGRQAVPMSRTRVLPIRRTPHAVSLLIECNRLHNHNTLSVRRSSSVDGHRTMPHRDR